MAYITPQKITEPMPRHCFEHDRQWINDRLNYCSSIQERLKVCEAYSKVYSATLEAEPTEHRQVNAARKAANTRLREYIAKKFRVFNK